MKTKKSKTGKTKCIAIAIVILFQALSGKAQWVDQSDQLPGMTTPTYVWGLIGLSAALVITTSIILIAKHSKKKRTITSMVQPEMNSKLKSTPSFSPFADRQFHLIKPCSYQKFELIKTNFSTRSNLQLNLFNHSLRSLIYNKELPFSFHTTSPIKLQ
jgi:hypothetical protein